MELASERTCLEHYRLEDSLAALGVAGNFPMKEPAFGAHGGTLLDGIIHHRNPTEDNR